MRYAEEQLTRPRMEHGSDFGYARRSVLVRNGEKQLLHQAGYKYRSGIGQQGYTSTEIALYGPKVSYNGRKVIHKGRVTPEVWQELAPQIYEHLGMEFPLKLISLKHTLLLDESGEVTEPPTRPKSPACEYPRVASEDLYRVVENPEDRKNLKIREYKVEKQSRDTVTFSYEVRIRNPRTGEIRISRREDSGKVERLAGAGYAETIEAAKQMYLKTYEDTVKSTQRDILAAAMYYARAKDDLAEARERLKALEDLS